MAFDIGASVCHGVGARFAMVRLDYTHTYQKKTDHVAKAKNDALYGTSA